MTRSPKHRRLARLALALVRSCGIYAPDVPDAAAEVLHRIWRQPARRRRAAGLESVRRRLARQLRRPAASLPAEGRALRAIGEYEAARREYAERFGAAEVAWQGGFSAHDRHFAEANGVCPRCARVHDFAAQPGCACGFSTER